MDIKLFQRGFAARLAAEDTPPDAPAQIFDVSVLTVGEAKTHGFLIDQKTLETALECLRGRKVKAFDNHYYFGASPADAVGVFEDFYIDGEKLRARTFTFFQSTAPETRAKLLEMARVCPEEFGTSIVADGGFVWIMSDGSEMATTLYAQKPAEAVSEMPVGRFTEISSIDFVSEPAANSDGLLAKQQILPQHNINPPTKEIPMQKALQTLSARFAGDAVKLSKAMTRLAALSEEPTDEQTKQIGDDVEKETEDEKLRARLDALEAENKELKDSNEKLKKQLEEKSASDEEDKDKAERLARSGAPEINLGTPPKAEMTAAEFDAKYTELCSRGDTVALQKLFYSQSK